MLKRYRQMDSNEKKLLDVGPEDTRQQAWDLPGLTSLDFIAWSFSRLSGLISLDVVAWYEPLGSEGRLFKQ